MTTEDTSMTAPIPMLIWCPFGHRHIDEGELATKPHHTHACQHLGCGIVWRPAKVNTVGVELLPGFKNEPAPKVAPDEAAPRAVGDRLIRMESGVEQWRGEITSVGPDGFYIHGGDGRPRGVYVARELDSWFIPDPHEARAAADATVPQPRQEATISSGKSAASAPESLPQEATPSPAAPMPRRRMFDPREPTAPLRSGRPPVTPWASTSDGQKAIALLRAALASAPAPPWTKGSSRKLAGLSSGDATRALAFLVGAEEIATKGGLYGPPGFTAWPAPRGKNRSPEEKSSSPSDESHDVEDHLAELDADAEEEAAAHAAQKPEGPGPDGRPQMLPDGSSNGCWTSAALIQDFEERVKNPPPALSAEAMEYLESLREDEPASCPIDAGEAVSA